MDINKAIRNAVDNGKVEFGSRSAVRGAAKAKLVLVASNCPPQTRKEIEDACAKANVPIQTYAGTSMDLGAICGRPFGVSVLTVMDAGTSGILEMVKK